MFKKDKIVIISPLIILLLMGLWQWQRGVVCSLNIYEKNNTSTFNDISGKGVHIYTFIDDSHFLSAFKKSQIQINGHWMPPGTFHYTTNSGGCFIDLIYSNLKRGNKTQVAEQVKDHVEVVLRATNMSMSDFFTFSMNGLDEHMMSSESSYRKKTEGYVVNYNVSYLTKNDKPKLRIRIGYNPKKDSKKWKHKVNISQLPNTTIQ